MELLVSCWCLPKWNPHPCGYYVDFKRECRCYPRQIEQYHQRIYGPLLDRIDLHVEVPVVEYREPSSTHQGESSEIIRERVISARKIHAPRFTGKGATTNAAMGPGKMKAHCQIDSTGSTYLEQAMEQMSFSACADDRIPKVSRTLADFAEKRDIGGNEALEAIQFRSLDRRLLE